MLIELFLALDKMIFLYMITQMCEKKHISFMHEQLCWHFPVGSVKSGARDSSAQRQHAAGGNRRQRASEFDQAGGTHV